MNAQKDLSEQSNFFAVINGKTKDQISYLFQNAGWTVHKPSLKGYRLKNSQGDLMIDSDKDEKDLLIHGMMDYNASNVQSVIAIFDQSACPYKFEFYDERNQLLFEKIGRLSQ